MSSRAIAVLAAASLAVASAHAAAKRVDVGGYKLSIRCLGDGTPAVVLDSGAGDTSATWDWVVPEVKRFTKVCAYDRAGLGKSDAGPAPRSSETIVRELHDLLLRAGVPPPYVLVGHSFGGLNMRLYAARHRDDVVGLVLVDATPVEFPEREASLLSAAEREKLRTAAANAPQALRDELDAAAASAAAVRDAGPPPDVPVFVLSATHRNDPERFREAWSEMQRAMVAAFPRATQILAATSDHYIPFDQPDLVVDSIREVVDTARKRP